MYIYYVIGLFVVLLLFSILKRKWAISTYVISIYLFSLIVALGIEAIFPIFGDSEKGSFIFASGICLFILPYIKQAPTIIGLTNPKSIKSLTELCTIISITLVVLEIAILPAVINSFSIGIADLREGERAVQSSNPIMLIFIKLMDFLNPLSFALLTIYFYLFTFVPGQRSTKTLLLLASLSAPYFGILYGGRTQMTYWLMSLGFNYLLFNGYLNPQKRRSLNRYALVIVGLIIAYIGLATIERFGDTSSGTQNSLLTYIGQPYWNFNNFIDNYHSSGSISLYRIFPLSYSLLYGNLDLHTYRDLVAAQSGMDIGIFYTFIGDLYVDIGLVGMYMYAIVYFVITRLVLKKKTMALSDLLIVGLLFLIPLQGVFYYSFWKRQVTFCAILVVILSRILKRAKV